MTLGDYANLPKDWSQKDVQAVNQLLSKPIDQWRSDDYRKVYRCTVLAKQPVAFLRLARKIAQSNLSEEHLWQTEPALEIKRMTNCNNYKIEDFFKRQAQNWACQLICRALAERGSSETGYLRDLIQPALLVADDFWLQNIWFPYLKNQPDEYGAFLLRKTLAELDFQIEGLSNTTPATKQTLIQWCGKIFPTGDRYYVDWLFERLSRPTVATDNLHPDIWETTSSDWVLYEEALQKIFARQTAAYPWTTEAQSYLRLFNLYKNDLAVNIEQNPVIRRFALDHGLSLPLSPQQEDIFWRKVQCLPVD